VNRDSNPVTVASGISLRPATAADEIFLLEVYASTRADEMALLPWSDEQKRAFVLAQFNAQQQHYRQTYPDATHDIILSHNRATGHFHVAWLEDEIRIVDIALHPRDRNRGIGSDLLRNLISEASKAGKLLTVYVESFNPALRLFERLGFSRSDEQGIHILMQRLPGLDRSDLSPHDPQSIK
jgi:ribosomal protein S18 acetylase RimI-like enzyme